MPIPILAARIEKPDDLAGVRVQAAQVTPFVEIAQVAGPG
jgi:hypothetical protein